MTAVGGIEIPGEALAELCRKHHVRELALFGSMARGEARPESDIDLLVEFEPDAVVGFIGFAGLQEELTELLGKRVDLVPKKGLKAAIRGHVLTETVVVYAA